MGDVYRHTPLGKSVSYCAQYDPSLLAPLPRQDKRAELGIEAGREPFHGVDVWTGYELSWLNAKRFPQVAAGHFVFPADSPFLIESKSFKLYLNSFNDTVFESWKAVEKTLARDLSAASGKAVKVTLRSVESPALMPTPLPAHAVCLDDQDIEIKTFELSPRFLQVDSKSAKVKEMLYSHLLKSNCLVTGQPDWGTVFIDYAGQPIDRAGLIQYLISFRHHWEFHEQCVERIFMDILRYCRPDSLVVGARYLRRGGLDINPVRSTRPIDAMPWERTARQ